MQRSSNFLALFIVLWASHSNAQGITPVGGGGGGSGTLTSVTPGSGLVSDVTSSCVQTAITTTGTLSEASCLNAQTGATYTILDTDRSKLVTLSNAAAIAVTVPQAGTASTFANGWRSTFMNKGVGTATFTPTTSTINGSSTYVLFSGQSVTIISDGTNYQIDPGTSGGIAVSSQTGANYAFVSSDFGKLINLSNVANQIPTLPVASALGTNWFTQACNQGAGTQTITPTTSTIGGAANYVLAAGAASAPKCVGIVSDGTNYQVIPDAGGGTPGGSSGQIQYNNAGAFGGFTMATDCTFSQPNINCNLAHPGYVANNWYMQPGINNPSVTQNGALAANTIVCSYAAIPRNITVLAMSTTVSVIGTSNVQYAIYANASGRPSTIIGNTGSVVNTSTGPRDANLAASKNIGPGGTNGGRDVWFCANQNDSTAQYINNGGVNFNMHQMIGSSTSANLGTAANDTVVGIQCAGVNCAGGSSTFGAWPGTLAASTWTQIQPSVTGANMPVFQYKAQ